MGQCLITRKGGSQGKLKYVGSVSFNYGYDKTTTATCDISNTYSNYSKLSVDDIIFPITYSRGWLQDSSSIADANLSNFEKSYDPSTGIITISAIGGYNYCNTQFSCDIYVLDRFNAGDNLDVENMYLLGTYTDTSYSSNDNGKNTVIKRFEVDTNYDYYLIKAEYSSNVTGKYGYAIISRDKLLSGNCGIVVAYVDSNNKWLYVARSLKIDDTGIIIGSSYSNSTCLIREIWGIRYTSDVNHTRKYIIKDGVSQVGTIPDLVQYDGYLQRNNTGTMGSYKETPTLKYENHKYLYVEVMLTTAQYGTVGAYIKYGNDIVTVLRGNDGPILNKRVIAGFNVSSDAVLGFGQADTNTTVYRIYNAWFE